MRLSIVALLMALAACKEKLPPEKASAEHVYALYRSGAVIPTVRLHVATFETAGEEAGWNMNNCEQVARILNQAKSKEQYQTRFWCKKGRYRE